MDLALHTRTTDGGSVCRQEGECHPSFPEAKASEGFDVDETSAQGLVKVRQLALLIQYQRSDNQSAIHYRTDAGHFVAALGALRSN